MAQLLQAMQRTSGINRDHTQVFLCGKGFDLRDLCTCGGVGRGRYGNGEDGVLSRDREQFWGYGEDRG